MSHKTNTNSGRQRADKDIGGKSMKHPLPRSTAILAAGLLIATGNSFAQTLPVCAANGAAAANGSGIVYLQFEVPAPGNVVATNGTLIGKVDISWDAVDPTAKYWVYRDGVLISAVEGITATTFTDGSPDGYRTYAYTVTAGLDGGVSGASVANSGYALGDGAKLALAATDGTITDKVNLSWTKIAGADGYKVYKNDALLATISGDATTTSVDSSVAGLATVYAYAVSAYKGATETSRSTDNGHANVTPSSVTGEMETLINEVSSPFTPVVVDANNPGDTFTFAVTAQGAHGSVTVVNDKLVYAPVSGYQGVDAFTVRVTDRAGASVTGQVNILVGCPVPLFYGIDVSDNLSKLVGTAQVSPCGDPASTKVQMKILSGGYEVASHTLSLEKIAGDNKYYSFAGDISSLTDGTYSVNLSLTDAYNHTASAQSTMVVDWNSDATPSFTYKGVPIFTGTTNTESFGNIGVR